MSAYSFNDNAYRRFCRDIKGCRRSEGNHCARKGRILAVFPAPGWRAMICANRMLTVKASVTLSARFLIYGCEREYSVTEIANDIIAEEGEQLFNYHCLACHGAGQGMPPFPLLPGTGALQVKYNGSIPAVLAD
ncbi:MAG: hypothetical protein R3C55_00045 [Parvularculaceae bacterium]